MFTWMAQDLRDRAYQKENRIPIIRSSGFFFIWTWFIDILIIMFPLAIYQDQPVYEDELLYLHKWKRNENWLRFLNFLPQTIPAVSPRFGTSFPTGVLGDPYSSGQASPRGTSPGPSPSVMRKKPQKPYQTTQSNHRGAHHSQNKVVSCYPLCCLTCSALHCFTAATAHTTMQILIH